MSLNKDLPRQPSPSLHAVASVIAPFFLDSNIEIDEFMNEVAQEVRLLRDMWQDGENLTAQHGQQRSDERRCRINVYRRKGEVRILKMSAQYWLQMSCQERLVGVQQVKNVREEDFRLHLFSMRRRAEIVANTLSRRLEDLSSSKLY